MYFSETICTFLLHEWKSNNFWHPEESMKYYRVTCWKSFKMFFVTKEFWDFSLIYSDVIMVFQVNHKSEHFVSIYWSNLISDWLLSNDLLGVGDYRYVPPSYCTTLKTHVSVKPQKTMFKKNASAQLCDV